MAPLLLWEPDELLFGSCCPHLEENRARAAVGTEGFRDSSVLRTRCMPCVGEEGAEEGARDG